jgi:RND superfamily putative drug exporter
MILLIIALPFAPMVGDVLVYEETEMAPNQLESEKAMEFIEDEFGDVMSGESTIIVLTSENILDNQSKDVIYRTEKELFNASHDGRIEGKLTSESLYSLLTDYSAGVMTGMSRGISEGTVLVNMTADLLFGLPLTFQQIYWQSNGSAFIIWGMPDIHVQVWQSIRAVYPNWTTLQVDIAAYSQAVGVLQSHPIMQGMNSTLQVMAWSWFSLYISSWNQTALNLTLADDPFLRAQLAVQDALPAFLEAIPVEFQEFFTLIYYSFDLGSWGQYHILNQFCRSLIEGEINESNALEYFELFYQQWNGTDRAPDQEEFEALVTIAVIDYAEMLGGDEGEMLLAIFTGLGFSHWNDTLAQTELVVGMVSREAESQKWVVWEVEMLGDSPSFAQLYGLAERVVRNSTVELFPIYVPWALISNMVNVPANDTTMIVLTYESSSVAADSVGVVRDIVHSISSEYQGLVPYVTGGDAINHDINEAFDSDLEKIDPVVIVLILVLIGMFFRSIVASSIPPLSIGIAIGVAMAGIYFIGSYLTSIHYSVLAVMITAMLGAGCDYCIFILSRYREERINGLSKEESVRIAVEWAGEAVTTSGMTVMIGFGVLALGRFALLQSMGLSLAMGILIALLVALTLLPSIICLLGDRLFWPSKLETGRREKSIRKDIKEKIGYFGKSARFAVKHAKVIVLAALLISVPTTYLVLTLETSYDFIAGMPDTESKQGLEVLGEGFGQGRIDPTFMTVNFTMVVLDGDEFDMESLDIVENISHDLDSLPHVKEVMSPTRPLGEPINYRNLSEYSPLVATEYLSLMKYMVGENRTTVLIQVILETEPFAKESIDLVTEIRSVGSNATMTYPTVQQVLTTGSTAVMFDISEMVQEDFSQMQITVIVGIYLVLLVVLGSVLIPLRLIITILLSISWTIAITMLVFIHIVGTPILWMMPMILFVICMGLGMDYDILLTTRIREEVSKGKKDKEAIVEAVERTGKVITICGIIMAGAFATMMLSSTALLQQFGFALAFAILLDAIIVRIYLVPAIMVLLEGYNWWAPGRLQRVRTEEKIKHKEWKKAQKENK